MNGATIATATSTSIHCETVIGCSMTDSDSTTTSTTVVGTQTIAPIGTWNDETWTSKGDEEYSSLVFAILSRDLMSQLASNDGVVISFTSGPSVAPTCPSSTSCGGQLCADYWCLTSPTGHPPGFQDPKDPSSDGYSAPTTTIGGLMTTEPPTTTPPTATNVTPLTRGPVYCFDESYFPGHADIQPGRQDELAKYFSGERDDNGDNTIGPGDRGSELRAQDEHGVNYEYSYEWIKGCVTEVEKQDFAFPLGSPSFSEVTAYLLVREDYTKCNNGGVGGWCQVGCLLYTFVGARGNERSLSEILALRDETRSQVGSQ